jgi:hypothetical protein
MTPQLSLVWQGSDKRPPQRGRILQEEERKDREQEQPRQVRKRAHDRQQRSLNRLDGALPRGELRLIDALPQLEGDPQTFVIARPAMFPRDDGLRICGGSRGDIVDLLRRARQQQRRGS